MQAILFKLFNKMIRLEVVDDSQALSSSTNQSVKLEINVYLLTIESLEAIFNLLLKQIDKPWNYNTSRNNT